MSEIAGAHPDGNAFCAHRRGACQGYVTARPYGFVWRARGSFAVSSAGQGSLHMRTKTDNLIPVPNRLIISKEQSVGAAHK